jgi:hypothetical protein
LKWGAWLPLDSAEPVEAAFQVRIAASLIAYPKGKSAMVFYGAGQRSLAAFRTAHAGEGLLVRFSSMVEAPRDIEAEISREVDRFAERFGAPPRFNS